MGKKALDAERTIEMLQSMAKETSDQNGQFSGYAGWLTSQHMHSGRLSSGRTATAIANFWKETHRPFLNLLRDVMQDFSEKLNQLQNDISDTFTSEAVVKESFMMDQLYDELDQLKTVARQHGEALWDIKSEYSDVLSMPSFDYSRIEQSLSNSQNIINETTSQLYDTDSKMKTPMDYVAEDIELMRTYVDQIRTMISSGTLSIENFSRSQIRDEEAYKDVKSAWSQRNLHNTLAYANSFLAKPYGVFDNYILGGANVLSGGAIGVAHYASRGKVPFNPLSIGSSYLSKFNSSAKIINKFSSAYNGAKAIAYNSLEAGVSRVAQNKTVQSFSDRVKSVESKLSHITNSRATKLLGPAGALFTGLGHVDEFTSQDNRDKTTTVKTARFVTGVAVETGGAVLGASIGAAVLAPIPGGAIVGAAVGGVVGGKVASTVVDYAKDGVEYIVSGEMLDDMREIGSTVASTVINAADSITSAANDFVEDMTSVASDVGDAVNGFFSDTADSVAGWFR